MFDKAHRPPPTGSRILVLAYQYQWIGHSWVKGGTAWKEAHFVKGKWEIWCGDNRTTTTEPCNFKFWSPCPALPEKQEALKYASLLLSVHLKDCHNKDVVLGHIHREMENR